MKPSIRISIQWWCASLAASVLMPTADHQPAIGQDRLQAVAQVKRVRALGNVLLAPAAAEPMVAQIRQQLEPMLKVELSFASRAADLNDEERDTLVVAGKMWFDEFVVEYVKNQDPNERQMWLHGGGGMMHGGERSASDPRNSIEQGVAKVVADALSKDKAAMYESERTKRANFHRDATIAILVDRVDEKIHLSTEQRLKITDSLKANWDSGQIPPWEIFMMQPQALPEKVATWIGSELTASQQTVLSNTNKFPSQVFFGGLGWDGVAEVIDDIDLNPQASDMADTPPN